MRQRAVGIREFKSNLSSCLKRVKEGEALIITERGKPIGQLSRIDKPLREQLDEGVGSKKWSWSGKKWQPPAPKVKPRGKSAVSDLLVEDRE
jgi:prevent-host-death family protein